MPTPADLPMPRSDLEDLEPTDIDNPAGVLMRVEIDYQMAAAALLRLSPTWGAEYERHQRRFDTTGPIFDPTRWRELHGDVAAMADLAGILNETRAKIDRLVEGNPSLKHAIGLIERAHRAEQEHG